MPDLPDLPDLPFDADQATYDAWYEACLQAVAEREDFFAADLNDGVLNFITLHTVVERYPDRAEKAREHCPQIVRDAMGRLGMAMGAANIAQLLDVPRDEVQQIMFRDVLQRGRRV